MEAAASINHQILIRQWITSLLFSMTTLTFSFEEYSPERVCKLSLKQFERDPRVKCLEGTYDADHELPAVGSVIHHALIQFQQALNNVRETSAGVEIPLMNAETVLAIRLIRQTRDRWLFTYASDKQQIAVRCWGRLLERANNHVWEICETGNLRNVKTILNHAIVRATNLLALEMMQEFPHTPDWRNNIISKLRAETAENKETRLRAVELYRKLHPEDENHDDDER